MTNYTKGKFKDRLYFSSVRTYTLSLLSGLSGVKHYVPAKLLDKEFKVPVTFGNYEKSLSIDDKTEKELTKLNFNFIPRLVLSFDGMEKASSRQTQKYQTFKRYITEDDDKGCSTKHQLDFSYNSLAYDFKYTLLLQARGMTAATQITENILSRFNPSYTMSIQEFPLFEKTETQLLISDPEFEILDNFEEADVNIINVTFNLTLRGNIYSAIDIVGGIKSVKFFLNAWGNQDVVESNLGSYFEFENTVNVIHHGNGDGVLGSTICGGTSRYFDGTGDGSIALGDRSIVEEGELTVIEKRYDYSKYQISLIQQNCVPNPQEKTWIWRI